MRAGAAVLHRSRCGAALLSVQYDTTSAVTLRSMILTYVINAGVLKMHRRLLT